MNERTNETPLYAAARFLKVDNVSACLSPSDRLEGREKLILVIYVYRCGSASYGDHPDSGWETV